MFRLVFLTFFGSFRGTHEQEHHLHESPATITIPLVILAVLAVLGGLMGLPEFISHTHWLNSFLAPIFPHAEGHEHMAISTEFALMGLATALAVNWHWNRLQFVCFETTIAGKRRRIERFCCISIRQIQSG
jgi:NADH-quinone oxidoreductase subunit L